MENVVAQFFAILVMGIFLNISYRIVKFLKIKITKKYGDDFFVKNADNFKIGIFVLLAVVGLTLLFIGYSN